MSWTSEVQNGTAAMLRVGCLHIKAHLQVGRGHRVAGAIGVGESVQEGVQGPLDELNKWLFDGVLARAAQDAVLEDVRDALAVLHRRA